MRLEAKKWIGELIAVTGIFLLASCGGDSTSSSSLSESEGGGGTGISNTFDSPAKMGVGDIMSIPFDESTSVAVDFTGVEAGASFIVAIGSLNTSGAGTSMQLSSDLSLPEYDAAVGGMEVKSEGNGDVDNVYSAQEIMSAWLRASEDTLPASESLQADSVSMSKAAKLVAESVGETENFRVLASLSSVTSYVEVTGKIRCIGSKVVFYVDTAVSSEVLADSDVQTLCNEFDTVAGNEQTIFGETSDVDGDGKLHILMTKQINRLGALGGGIITGYFYAGDLYTRSNSNSVSNYREVIYTLVPDPSGQYGTAISKSFAMSNLLPAVLPHELQHAISYNQHVFENDGSPEENWLNEGMSHLAEDIMGYGVENPSRYAMYLASPSTYGVVTQGSPNLMERGEAYLFMRFLYEQSADGAAFIRSLESSSKRGVENLETAFAGPSDFDEFSEFISRFSVALAMTDRGISSDSRYIYKARTRNSVTGNYEGVCITCDPEDNRGTTLEGIHLNAFNGNHNSAIDSSAVMFYDVSSPPDQMRLAGSDGGGNFGVLIRYE